MDEDWDRGSNKNQNQWPPGPELPQAASCLGLRTQILRSCSRILLTSC